MDFSNQNHEYQLFETKIKSFQLSLKFEYKCWCKRRKFLFRSTFYDEQIDDRINRIANSIRFQFPFVNFFCLSGL